jgi:putative sigma-54 modulation protein
MNFEMKGIHFEIDPRTREYLADKMPRLDFAKDLIVDFLLNITKEKRRFSVEATINFRWGNSTHVGVKSFDLFKGIDELFDTLDLKIEKEKSKLKEHHKKQEPAGLGEE